jgi:protein-disulfide isomerase
MTEELLDDPTALPEIETVTPEAAAAPVEKRAGFRWSRLAMLFVPLAFAAGLGAGYLLWGRAASGAQGAAAQAQATGGQASGGQAQVTRYDVPVDDDPVLGPENAAITIIEFSDYECPYCRKWHSEVFPRLMAEYPDQVRVVFRDFPLYSIHPNAGPAAVAANCAAEQGAYWEFNQKLFSMELGLSAEAYQAYAGDLGLDVGSFGECLESERHAAEVQADYEFAAGLGVRSTPTFFINGIAVVGAQPYELFKEVIDKELAGEIPK